MICANCETPIPENSRFCLSCGADTSDPGTGPRPDLKAPSDRLFAQLRAAVVDRYDLEELLGRGGMGAVFLATDKKLGRPVAIKVLPPELSHDANIVERFEREAQTAAKLDHPNIIPIYAVESHGDFHYFVMKLVTGKSLEDILRAGPPPVDLSQRILWEAACALGHAHQRGIVHRDVKPANIMIDDSGRTVLTDFGISKAVESASNQLTATGQVVGTPHYMSPEQSKGGDVDGRSDQYSLAVVGYKMLTGRLPFVEDSLQAVLYKKLFEDPPWVKEVREDLPDYLAESLHTALARAPEHRYASMEAFATAIWPEHPVTEPSIQHISLAKARRSGIDSATTQMDHTPPTVVQTPRRRRRALGVAAAVVILGGGSVGTWYVLDSMGMLPGSEQPTPIAAVVPVVGDSQAVTPVAGDSASSDSAGVTADSERQVEQQPEERQVATQRETPPPSEIERQETRVSVPESRTNRPPAPTFGFLRVNAVPFATVWVDGVEVQDTPISRYELPPGPHIVELRREGFETIVDTIQISAGNTLSKSYTPVRRP